MVLQVSAILHLGDQQETLRLQQGPNAIGQRSFRLLLGHPSRCYVSRESQVTIQVDIRSQVVTVEQKGQNASHLNGRPLSKKLLQNLRTGDIVTLFRDQFPVTITIVDQSDHVPSQLEIVEQYDFDRPATDDETSGDEDVNSGLAGHPAQFWPDDFSEESDDIHFPGQAVLVAGDLDDLSDLDDSLAIASAARQPRALQSGQAAEPLGHVLDQATDSSNEATAPAAQSTAAAAAAAPTAVTDQPSRTPATAYGRFAQMRRVELKKQYPHSPASEITKLIRAEWQKIHQTPGVDPAGTASDDMDESSEPGNEPNKLPSPSIPGDAKADSETERRGALPLPSLSAPDSQQSRSNGLPSNASSTRLESHSNGHSNSHSNDYLGGDQGSLTDVSPHSLRDIDSQSAANSTNERPSGSLGCSGTESSRSRHDASQSSPHTTADSQSYMSDSTSGAVPYRTLGLMNDHFDIGEIMSGKSQTEQSEASGSTTGQAALYSPELISSRSSTTHPEPSGSVRTGESQDHIANDDDDDYLQMHLGMLMGVVSKRRRTGA